MTLPLKDKLARGEVVTMINPDHPSSSLVEFIGTLGFDAIFIDCEHGMAGIERVQDMCRAARVMVPHIDTAQAARDLVQAVRYARHSDYADKLVVAMVESERALGNLPEILGVDGIDVFFVGPGDLSNTLGMPGQRFHPKVRELVMQAGQRIVKSGKVAGTLVKRENAADYAEGGFRLLYEHANAFLREGAQAFRKSLPPG